MSDRSYMLRCGFPPRKAMEMVKKRKKAPEEETKTDEQRMAEAAENLVSPIMSRLISVTAPVTAPTKVEVKTPQRKEKKKAVQRQEEAVKEAPVAQGVSTEEYNAKCVELQMRARQIEDLRKKLAEADDKIRTLERNNSQLRNNISNTSRNVKNTDVTQLRSKVDNLESENRSLRHDIERYKMLVESYDIDVRNISSRSSLFAMMTSPTVMHCSAFENRKYTVQFGSRFKIVKFVPDADGAVECTDGDMDLAAFQACHADTLKKMPVTVVDGVITVTV